MKILFIEDDVLTIEPIVDFMSIKGHTVEIVSDAQDAIDRIESTSYDLILSDVMFAPGDFFTTSETGDGRYTGLRLLEYVREREAKTGLPPRNIILITNWRNEPTVDAVAQTHSAKIFRKPLSMANVEEILAMGGKNGLR